MPDTSYRLDAADRARARPEFDADALERLLQHLPPAERRMFLGMFSTSQSTSNTWFTVVGVTDPVLNSLLEEVWAPYWRDAPDDAVADPYSRIPGVERERERRGLRVLGSEGTE